MPSSTSSSASRIKPLHLRAVTMYSNDHVMVVGFTVVGRSPLLRFIDPQIAGVAPVSGRHRPNKMTHETSFRKSRSLQVLSLSALTHNPRQKLCSCHVPCAGGVRAGPKLSAPLRSVYRPLFLRRAPQTDRSKTKGRTNA